MKINKLSILAFLTLTLSSNVFANSFGKEFIKQSIESLAQNTTTTAMQSQQNMAKTIGNGGSALNCPEHYPLGVPVVNTADKDKVERRSFYLCRTAYAVQFDPAYKVSIWSAENLTKERMVGANEPREDDFRQDPQIPYPAQANLNDYKGSKFDRGHMSPAADMKIYNPSLSQDQLSQANTFTMSESFYLTNMVPQVGPNQNRGIWKDLEAQVRKWSMSKGQILVVTGPIYEAGYQTIGRSNVAVPTKLYKVLIDAKTYQSIAFIVPNVQVITKKTKKIDLGRKDYPQTRPDNAINCNSVCDISNFVVPVADVEKLTGLRFFSRLDDASHERVVSVYNANYWFGK